MSVPKFWFLSLMLNAFWRNLFVVKTVPLKKLMIAYRNERRTKFNFHQVLSNSETRTLNQIYFLGFAFSSFRFSGYSFIRFSVSMLDGRKCLRLFCFFHYVMKAVNVSQVRNICTGCPEKIWNIFDNHKRFNQNNAIEHRSFFSMVLSISQCFYCMLRVLKMATNVFW